MPRSTAARQRYDSETPEEATPSRGELVRLQKVLAEGGIASRRHAEDFILTGRVQVDGQVVKELGQKVDPWKQKIHVDGELIRRQKKIYFAVNKPPGVLSTNDDPRGRPRVIDLLPELKERFYPVGRLDEASQGIMLVTNDGELANQLLHPKFGVPKVYRVQVVGHPTQEELESLRGGHEFSEGTFRADLVKMLKSQGDSTFLEIVLREGHNREVRRLLARIGHKVVWLQRIAFGPLRLGRLAPGEFRSLTGTEVAELREAATTEPTAGRARPVSRKGRPVKGRPAGARTGSAKPAGKAPSGDAPVASGRPGVGRGRARELVAPRPRLEVAAPATRGAAKKSVGKKTVRSAKSPARSTTGRPARTAKKSTAARRKPRS